MWNTIAIILNLYLDPAIFFFCGYGNHRVITIRVLLLFFGDGIKCIVDQIENHTANILRNDIYFSNAIIKISFKFCIKGFVLCP